MLLSALLLVLGVQIGALGLLGELIIFTHARSLKEYRVERIVNPLSLQRPTRRRPSGITAACAG